MHLYMCVCAHACACACMAVISREKGSKVVTDYPVISRESSDLWFLTYSLVKFSSVY